MAASVEPGENAALVWKPMALAVSMWSVPVTV